MSDNQHVRAMKTAVAAIRDAVNEGQLPRLVHGRTIRDHADALATQLAEARAERDRWKRFAVAMDRYDDTKPDIAQLAVLEEIDAAYMDLEAHGDLDEPEATT